MSTELEEIPRAGELAEIALSGAVEGGDVDQPALVDSPPSGPVVKFLGIKASASDDMEWKNGQRVNFFGDGIVVHVGEDLNVRDNTTRKVLSVKVNSATLERD